MNFYLNPWTTNRPLILLNLLYLTIVMLLYLFEFIIEYFILNKGKTCCLIFIAVRVQALSLENQGSYMLPKCFY